MDALILLAPAVLLLRVGLAMYVGGLTRAKNSAGAVARVVADFAVAVLCAFVVGGVIVGMAGGAKVEHMFGHLTGQSIGMGAASLVLLATVATGIVVGPVAERSRFAVVIVCSVILAAIVLPVLLLWEYGWLGRTGQNGLGFLDWSGGAWLHVAGGTVALIAAKLVGARGNKYHRDGSASVIPGHNLPMAGVGALLMLTGLAGVAGVLGTTTFAIRGLPVLNTVLAAAAGGVASLVFAHFRYGKPDVLLLLAGLLGGAVSLAAGSVAPIWAVVIGAVAGVLVPFAAVELDLRLRIDDPAGAVAIHLVGGAWGTIAAGIFSGLGVTGTFRAIGVQFLGLAVTIAVAGALSLAVLKVFGDRLRSKEADEFDGLDLAEHDIGAYPDFQQNSIRSYHLRET
jgi:ammonium transporter, Amt family